MAENIIVYAGSNKAGKLRKKALEREARRHGRGTSVAEVVWEALKKAGSELLRADLAEADRIER